MVKNMGTVDQIVRIALAVVVAILSFTGAISGVAAIILGIFALIFVVTSFVGFCPLYALFEFSTRKHE